LCYYRDYTSTIDSDNSSQAGFRVARRDLAYSDPMPTVAISENFDGAAWIANGSGNWTIVAPSGTWTAGGSTHMIRNGTVSRSGTGTILFTDSDTTLTLPQTAGMPVGVSFWARAYRSNNLGYIALQEYDGTTWRTTESINVSGLTYAKVRLNVILAQASSGQNFRLYGYRFYIDDVQVFTVPR
jgi:hypothetical protein